MSYRNVIVIAIVVSGLGIATSAYGQQQRQESGRKSTVKKPTSARLAEKKADSVHSRGIGQGTPATGAAPAFAGDIALSAGGYFRVRGDRKMDFDFGTTTARRRSAAPAHSGNQSWGAEPEGVLGHEVGHSAAHRSSKRQGGIAKSQPSKNFGAGNQVEALKTKKATSDGSSYWEPAPEVVRKPNSRGENPGQIVDESLRIQEAEANELEIARTENADISSRDFSDSMSWLSLAEVQKKIGLKNLMPAKIPSSGNQNHSGLWEDHFAIKPITRGREISNQRKSSTKSKKP